MARLAIGVAAPVLVGELIASIARLRERAEWAESKVVRLPHGLDHLRSPRPPHRFGGTAGWRYMTCYMNGAQNPPAPCGTESQTTW